MLVRTRLSTHRYQLLNEETKNRIKELSAKYCKDMLFNHEFECFELLWEECNWLLVNLAEPEIFALWSAERFEHV